VSPLGGCLPLLIQFPFLFALYPVLQSTIELRHAGFIFWLKDLSIPDPYYILPILMGITMFFQQKLMSQQPTPNMDEKQLAQLKTQKFMMYGMPVFFVFIFKSLPAGLVLYWFTYNILSVIEQLSIRKKTQTLSQEIVVDKKK
ncbi:membrane protein insertase YidC, partial [bacterium]